MIPALSSLGAGHPGQVVQLGYLVPDLDAAMAQWLTGTNAGPFFRARFDLGYQVFRGRQSQGAIEVALAYRDDMCIELFEFQGTGPSVFEPGEGRAGYGLHHVMIATDEMDATLDGHKAVGEEIVVDADVPGFGRAAFADTRATLGHLTEYGIWSPPVIAAIGTMREAHRNWDGKDPLRPYPAF